MKKLSTLALILFFLSSCNNHQNDRAINKLKPLYQKEIQNNLEQFDRRYALSPAKAHRSHFQAFNIHKYLGQACKIIESNNPNIDSLQKYFKEGLSYYGLNNIEKDPLLWSRLEIINNLLKNNNIKNSDFEFLLLELESKLLAIIYNNIDIGTYKFNELEAIVVPDKTEVNSGETYQAKIYMAASDSTLGPRIMFENEFLPLENNYGILKINNSRSGLKQYKGKIEWHVEDPYKTIILPFEIKYTVK